jgi:purine-binding chemotaxis protein CheW
MSAPTSGTRRFATFFAGGMHLGVDVLQVQEILRRRDVARVPLAPAVVLGLMNLRGDIVTAIDLRRRLELPPADVDAPFHVVVKTKDGALSLAVDDVGDVVEVEDCRLEPPPPTLRGLAAGVVTGVHPMGKGLLSVLDVERVAILSHATAPRTETTHW